MELPLALRTALERSESDYRALLARLGLARPELARLAGRLQRHKPATRAAAQPAATIPWGVTRV